MHHTDDKDTGDQGVERICKEPRHPKRTVQHACDFETVHQLKRTLFVDLAGQIKSVDNHANVKEYHTES